MRIRKRHKFLAVLLLLVVLDVAAISYCLPLGIVMVTLETFAVFALFVFLVLNKAIKHTNWYKNIFLYTNQMCSNAGYRTYLIRNLEVVNLGSNPARFAFHYDNVLGENWSTGNQGKDMDFEILKFRHSFIKKGGYVLLPIIPFSGVAGFLKKYKPEYLGLKYYAKFAHTLDGMQVHNNPDLRAGKNWENRPLKYEPSAIKYLFFDEDPDRRLEISEMPLMRPQLIEDARQMWENWMKEFDIKDMKDPLSPMLVEGMEISTKVVQDMVDYLIERDLKPVLVLLPLAEPLQRYFTQEIKQKLIYDFIDKVNRPQITFLDYSNNVEFQDPTLFFNSIFMNLRGRKLFTQRVLTDLGILCPTTMT